jgi:hypothetical protein
VEKNEPLEPLDFSEGLEQLYILNYWIGSQGTISSFLSTGTSGAIETNG